MTFLTIFTLFHVAVSLIGIAAGIPVLYGMLNGHRPGGWTSTFLWSTLATTVTGFLFPFEKLTPGHIFGVLTLIALGLAIPALYRFRLAGPWHRTYVIGSVFSLYLNVFVLIAQLFEKVPALKAVAQPGFAVAQFLLLILFLYLGTVAATKAGNRPRFYTAGSAA